MALQGAFTCTHPTPHAEPAAAEMQTEVPSPCRRENPSVQTTRDSIPTLLSSSAFCRTLWHSKRVVMTHLVPQTLSEEKELSRPRSKVRKDIGDIRRGGRNESHHRNGVGTEHRGCVGGK